MEIEFQEGSSHMQVKLSGHFTYDRKKDVKDLLDSIRTHAPRTVDINFHEVEFIDSTGLGMLLMLRKECMNRNIAISISNIRGQVQKIFTISKMDQLFAPTES